MLTPIIRLPWDDLPRIERSKSLIKILHILAGKMVVVQRKGKWRFDNIHGTVEIVPDPIRNPPDGVRNNMPKVQRLRRSFDLFPPLPLWILCITRGRIMIDPPCLLQKEMMPPKKIAYGRDGDKRKTSLLTINIQQRLDLLFTQAGMLLTKLLDILDHLIGDGRRP